MIEPDAFRKAMRQIASGVFVVTTRLDDRLHATTATAFLPLSAEPPLVLLCIHQDSDTHKALSQTPHFGVNVLSQSQAALSRRFASKTPERYRLDDVPRVVSPRGTVFFQGSAAHIEVETISTAVGGDHTIFVGKVVLAVADARLRPLVYHQGDHHGLAPLAVDDDLIANRLTG